MSDRLILILMGDGGGGGCILTFAEMSLLRLKR